MSRFDDWMTEFEDRLDSEGTTIQVAREVFGSHFNDQALRYQELLDAERGHDIYRPFRQHVGQINMAVNARKRGETVDADGEDISDPNVVWFRLYRAAATMGAYAVAQGRWARGEHDRAERLRSLLQEASAIAMADRGIELLQRIDAELAKDVQVAEEIDEAFLATPTKDDEERREAR